MREIGWLQLSSNGEKGNSQHSKNSSEFFSPNHPFPFSPSYILGDLVLEFHIYGILMS